MKTLLLLVAWCLLFVLCWPLLWLLSLPFRMVGVVVEALIAFLKAVLLLPARILRGPTPGRSR